MKIIKTTNRRNIRKWSVDKLNNMKINQAYKKVVEEKLKRHSEHGIEGVAENKR